MAMLGLGITDAEAIAGILSGNLREIPDYCNPLYKGWSPAYFYRGILPQCQPYTIDELRQLTLSQATGACEKSDDPAACVAAQVKAGDVITHTPPATVTPDAAGSSECEYRALEEHPTLAHILSPEVLCRLQQGEYTLYLVVGGAALLYLFTRGK